MTIVFVHGFANDPASAVAADNPTLPTGMYTAWTRMLNENDRWLTLWFTWWSVPQTFKAILRAWRHGYWNRYAYAWDLAREASHTLLKSIRVVYSNTEPVDIICHSLGARVALGAVALGARVSRVIIFNGAEYLSTAAKIAQDRPDVEFFSVCTKSDDVLNVFGRLAPGSGTEFVGNTPLVLAGLDNWTNLPLDDTNFRGIMKTLYGWDLAADDPDRIADHWFSHRNPNNWPLYRAILARSWPPLKGD